MPAPHVEAAGGVIVRDRQLLVVHRPHREDWSLPKGKLEQGESFEDAALREVLEETGLTCKLGEELPEVHYEDHRKRPKTVRYWLMTVEDGELTENDEVDEFRWVGAAEALEVLTYEDDKHLVRWVVEQGGVS